MARHQNQPRDPGTASRGRWRGPWSRWGAHDGAEVHIVYSARDLVRQIPAEWQENVKHRRAKPYGGSWSTSATSSAAPRSHSGSGASRRCRTCSTAGPSRSPATGCTWSPSTARLEPDPALGTVRRPVRDRRRGVRAHGQGQHLTRGSGVGDAPPAQRAAQRRTAQPPLPDLRPRAPGPPEPVVSAGTRRGCPCRRTPTAGRATWAGRGSASWRCAGTTWSVTSTTWSRAGPAVHRPRRV